MKDKICIIFAICLLASITSTSAQEIALDVSIKKQIYSAGENVSYNILLLKNSAPYSDMTKVLISDIEDRNHLNYDVESNKENFFHIDKDFPSGYWKIEASYQGKTIKRFFTIGEREEAEFSMEGDALIIRNSGNVPYTKNVQILIGEKAISQKQYIEMGKFKEIKLVAPDGNYNIQVSDGMSSISRQGVHLTGTGAVIGALDEQLAQSQSPLGGARDTSSESFFTGNNFTVAFIFIGAVFGLFILLAIERTMHKKRASRAKDMVRLH